MKPFMSLASPESSSQPKPALWTRTKLATLIAILVVGAVGGG